MNSVLLIEPGCRPERIEIGDELEDLQEKVGGWIETVYPFNDEVALVVNEEGKVMGLPMNRAVYDEDGNVSDILCGNILIVGTSEEEFTSLTEEQFKTYEELYAEPEEFYLTGRRWIAVPAKH